MANPAIKRGRLKQAPKSKHRGFSLRSFIDGSRVKIAFRMRFAMAYQNYADGVRAYPMPSARALKICEVLPIIACEESYKKDKHPHCCSSVESTDW